MKLIRTEDAVGHVICHDITQIIRGVTKDAVFRKGHIVTEEDIPVLLSVGKENLYVWEKEEGMLHEDEAALILKEICQGEHMHPSGIKEGKIELIADCDGVLKIDKDGLRRVNSVGEMMIATRHGNFPVKKGDKLAGMRVIPLVIHEDKMAQAKKAAGDKPLLQLLPYQHKKVGIVTTGSEVYYHRIEDTFTPVPSLRTLVSCSASLWARAIGYGMYSSVSLVAKPNIIPWSPAPMASISSSDMVCSLASSALSTPRAISADCSSMAVMTPQVSASKPYLPRV